MKRGRREGRALAAPVARLQKRKQAAVTTGLAGYARPSPRDGFAAYTRSPWGPAVLPPSPQQFVIAGLASAPGCQDHAISPSHRIVRRRELYSGMIFPENRYALFRIMPPRCNPTRPPHPAPDVRDDREAPLCGTGCGDQSMISEKSKQEYFCAQDWTGRVALKALAKLAVWRNDFGRE